MTNVSISKEYFDTLIRRAEVHDNRDTVTLPRLEYDALIRVTHEYQALRTALISGGVPEETLDVLVNTPIVPAAARQAAFEGSKTQPSGQTKWFAEAPVFLPRSAQKDGAVDDIKAQTVADNSWRSNPQSATPSPDGFSYNGRASSITSDDKDEVAELNDATEEDHYENNHEDRSLVLKGLSKLTTIADVLQVVRGGKVLNVYIRPRDRTAHVAFVSPDAAEKFLTFSKRSDVYIRGKRVEVFWDDRQHYMPGHVARNVACNGASRNLVVRFATPEMTAESIREDLDHIHRLEVVDITFNGGHAFISLNSINHALAARSCMASRLKYKGTRIEFYPDECEQPLPPIAKKTFKKSPPPQQQRPKTSSININRFQMLSFDGLNGDGEFELSSVAQDLSADESVTV